MNDFCLKLRLCGAAGQGLKTAAQLLGKAVTRSNLWAHCYSEVESRVRGGVNSQQFLISSKPRREVRKKVDLLLATSQEALDASQGDLETNGFSLGPNGEPLGLERAAKEAGSVKVISTVALAAAGALLSLKKEILKDLIEETFASRGEKILQMNLAALDLVYEKLPPLPSIPSSTPAGSDNSSSTPAGSDGSKGLLWMSGHEALSLGAIAGGVSFIAAYPMSPATSCLMDLQKSAKETGVVALQCEDEIAAINMLAGASFAGARAMTATSGGGFSLMTEGLSLIGEIEAPAVIILAQRPGPATGMATKTAQEDLWQAVYGGHGYFPRIVLAPRDIEDSFHLGAQAFALAERYQVAVILLTSQLLQESYATVEEPSLEALPRKRSILSKEELEDMEDYCRYALCPGGVSPLAFPGSSRHRVMADSHTHDERGHLSESPAIAEAMAEKKLAKERSIAAASFPLEVEGDLENNYLLVSFGSNYESIRHSRRVIEQNGSRPPAQLHVRWLWPPPREALREILSSSKGYIVIENSVGAVFADYLESFGKKEALLKLSKVNGRPFYTEEILSRLEEELGL